MLVFRAYTRARGNICKPVNCLVKIEKFDMLDGFLRFTLCGF